MARNKHSAALFEVIAKSRQRGQSPRGRLFSALGDIFRPAPNLAPPPPHAPEPAETSPVVHDPERKCINIQVSYATAGILILAVCTALAGAFLTGKHFRLPQTPTTLSNATSEQVRTGPINSTVLAVGKSASPEPIVIPSRIAQAPASRPAFDRTRTPGMNYVVVQSYPELKMAQEAQKILADNGIECTIEKNLPRWANGEWFSVVSIEGYEKITGSPARDSLMKRIKDVNESYATKKNSFKAFSPGDYNWRKK
jgi:hypothetical protein